MEIPLSLQPYHLTPDDLQRPMAFDVFNGKGALLVRKGTRIQGDGEFLLSQLLYRERDCTEIDFRQSLTQLEALYRQYDKLTQRWTCQASDVLELRRLAGSLVHLCGSHSDLCVAMVSHLDGKRHAIRHCFATAVVAVLIGDALGWNLRRQHTLARAALTMDISILRESERSRVFRHPEVSAMLLMQSTCVDMDWYTAVDQHHENLDGTGYPVGLKGGSISAEARVLRIADTWCTLVLLPPGKVRKTPKDALHEMGRHAGRHFDHHAFLALKKLMGPYPPGTFVRLANRETAIVMRWDKQGTLPKFATSVLSPTGETAREFKVRAVGQRGYEIQNYTYLDMAQMARFSMSQVWAEGAV